MHGILAAVTAKTRKKPSKLSRATLKRQMKSLEKTPSHFKNFEHQKIICFIDNCNEASL